MRLGVVASGMIAVLLAGVSPVLAQSSTATLELPSPNTTVTAGVDLMATSAYVWRGFIPTREPSLQPAPWVKVGSVTFTSWSNFASRGSAGRPVTEHDATIDYTGHSGTFAVSVGYTNYFFPDASSDLSHELYAGVAHDSYFSPSLRVYRDVSAGKGTYANFSIAHSYEISNGRLTLTPNAAIGYNHHQWMDRSTWSDLAIGVKASLPPVSARVSISPFIMYSRSLAADLLPSRLYGGVIVSVK